MIAKKGIGLFLRQLLPTGLMKLDRLRQFFYASTGQVPINELDHGLKVNFFRDNETPLPP
jgi:hypothetical protein